MIREIITTFITAFQTVVFWSIFIFSVVVCPIIFFPLRFFPQISRVWFFYLLKSLSSLMLFLMFGVKIKNELNLKEVKEPLLVISNHLGLIDSMVILKIWPRPVGFFLAAVLSHTPIGRLFAELTGFLPIGRKSNITSGLEIYNAFKRPADFVLFTDKADSENTLKLIQLSGRTTLKIEILGAEDVLPKYRLLAKPGTITVRRA